MQKAFKKHIFSIVFALASVGSLGVGLFPENTFIVNGVPIFHAVFARMAFVIGGFAAIFSKITTPPFKYISIILGVGTLLAAVLFFTTASFNYIGLGAGGMERMMAYPTLMWIAGFGGYLLAN